MRQYGFLRVSAAMPIVHVADPTANCERMVALVEQASLQACSLVAFPELSITGYTCADLFGQDKLLLDAQAACKEFVAKTAGFECVTVFGCPVRYRGRLYNCAIVARKGRILGIVPKTFLAGNAEFYEPRWFASAQSLKGTVNVEFASQCDIPMGTRQLFKLGNALFAVELCQDLWSPVPPSCLAALSGAHLIVNLSASNEVLLKQSYRRTLISSTSARLSSAYLYCSSGYGESTQDLVWAGASLIYENGSSLAESELFVRKPRLLYADIDIDRLENLRSKEYAFEYDGEIPEYSTIDCGQPAQTDFEAMLLRKVEPHPFVPQLGAEEMNSRCREILSAQIFGLCTRLEHIRCRRAVLGISGGLDSTLALIVTALAFDELGLPRKNILCVTMPGFGTSARTHSNSASLMELLGVESREISIVPATRQHFSDIAHDESVHDLTYENSQARERTQILMDLAGSIGGIVVGTGDLSELALGWCTYNGDHMSMYGVNASVPKTLVRTMVLWAANNIFESEAQLRKVLLDVADTPISPELVPVDEDGKIAQITEDLVGPYELHDFYLYNFLRWGYTPDKLLFLARKAFAGVYEEATLEHWLRNFLRRFFSQQFKRSCIPDGPKVGSVSLSPRGDWRMPSDIEKAWDI